MRLLLLNPQPSNDTLARLCAARGWSAAQVPLHEYAAPWDDGAALHEAVRRIGDFSWAVVCSPRAADMMLAALNAQGRARAISATPSRGGPTPMHCAAVGSATAEVLRAGGVRVDLVGASDVRALGAELVRVYSAQLHRARIAIFQAEEGREEGRAVFAAHQIIAEKIPCYRLVEIPDRAVTPALHTALPQLDWIVCTAPSAVHRLFALLPKLCAAASPTTRFAALGPTTAAALREYGIGEMLQPALPHFSALIDAMAATESI